MINELGQLIKLCFERTTIYLMGLLILAFTIIFTPAISQASQLPAIDSENVDLACSAFQISDLIEDAVLGVKVDCLSLDKATATGSGPSTNDAQLPESAAANLILEQPDDSPLSGDRDLLTALENVPAFLTLENPVYHIGSNRRPPKKVKLSISLPDGVESPQTLDLYGWNGQEWQWLPHRKLLVKNTLEAELDFWPEVVALMRTPTIELKASIDFYPDMSLPDDINDIVAEINPTGLRFNTGDRITGKPGELPSEIRNRNLAVIPTLRNWNRNDPDQIYSSSNLLLDQESQERHIKAIVDLVRQGNYQGIDLDYRGINPELRQEFTIFLSTLRAALPKNKQLSIRAALPLQLSTGTWDTGPFDWQTLGLIVDVIKVYVSPDPKAYTPSAVSGQSSSMEAMLDWAVGQVDRSKLQLLYRANSTYWLDQITHDIDHQQAFGQLGEVALVNIPNKINPGQMVNFTLAALPTSTGIQIEDSSGTYWFAFLDEENRHHTIYLENAAGIAPVLELASRYHLRGIAIQDLGDGRPDFWELIRGINQESAAPNPSQYKVMWRVQRQDGPVLSEETVDLSRPNYDWTAPASGGVYEVEARIDSDHFDTTISQGKMVLSVATPAPTPRPAVQQSAPARPPGPTPPAVPPVNVSFSYGIQADPRGDIGVNIGHIKTLGLTWVKFQMPWKDVESAPGDFSWAPWDELVNAYHNNGIQILLSIPKAPDWARPVDDDKSVEGPPQDLNLYAGFVAGVAERYRGRVQAIEIWNEQNLWYEAGGMGRISAANYVNLLQLSYIAIKAANPEIIVVSGGLTPAGNVGEAAVDDIDYLRQMYANGAKGFFDALGAHPSGYNCPAGGDWRVVSDSTATSFRGTFENRHHSWCFRGTMEGYREVMVANGDGDKMIIPTEFGWAADNKPKPGYEYAQDNTYEEQAQWIVEAYQLGKSWGWVGPMFLWNLDYGVTAPGTELASFGIINRPAYEALRAMPK